MIIFLGVCEGITVYITQRILLKSCPPSVLNLGLISSLASWRYAWRPLNGLWLLWVTRLVSSPVACWDSVGELRLRRIQVLCSLETTHTHLTSSANTQYTQLKNHTLKQAAGHVDTGTCRKQHACNQHLHNETQFVC